MPREDNGTGQLDRAEEILWASVRSMHLICVIHGEFQPLNTLKFNTLNVFMR